jgi:alanine-synthesizing transaminase
VILNFPNNPSGQVVSAEWWKAVVAVARSNEAFVINDFVYGEMCFSRQPAPSVLSVGGSLKGVLEVYSLSKAYNVPGWRVGALVGDETIVRAVARHKSVADYGLFLPLQYAAAGALTASEDLVRPTVTAYERRIKVLSQGLKRLGWSVVEPAAGASVWARFSGDLLAEAREFFVRREGSPERHPIENASSIATEVDQYGDSDSSCVARLLLEKYGVLVAPGIAFGGAFDHFVRFAAVMPEERLRDVVSALSSR